MKKHPTGLSLELRKQILFSLFVFSLTVDGYLIYTVWTSQIYWLFLPLAIPLYSTYFTFKNWKNER